MEMNQKGMIKIFAIFMILSSVMAFIPNIVPSSYIHNGSSEDYTIAYEKATPVPKENLDKVLSKEYDLDIIVSLIGQPHFISYNNHVEIHSRHIRKFLESVEKLHDDDVAMIAWRGYDDKIYSTYISTKDEGRRVVGFYSNDDENVTTVSKNEFNYLELKLGQNTLDIEGFDNVSYYNTQFKLDTTSKNVIENEYIERRDSVVKTGILVHEDEEKVITVVDDIVQGIGSFMFNGTFVSEDDYLEFIESENDSELYFLEYFEENYLLESNLNIDDNAITNTYMLLIEETNEIKMIRFTDGENMNVEDM